MNEPGFLNLFSNVGFCNLIGIYFTKQVLAPGGAGQFCEGQKGWGEWPRLGLTALKRKRNNSQSRELKSI